MLFVNYFSYKENTNLYENNLLNKLDNQNHVSSEWIICWRLYLWATEEVTFEVSRPKTYPTAPGHVPDKRCLPEFPQKTIDKNDFMTKSWTSYIKAYYVTIKTGCQK